MLCTILKRTLAKIINKIAKTKKKNKNLLSPYKASALKERINVIGTNPNTLAIKYFQKLTFECNPKK